MATFPTLTPSSRIFTPGRHPHSEIPTLNGLQTRVMTSNVILEQRLRLTFVALTEAQMLGIRSHYIGQQGRFLSFDIPASLLSGMTTPSYFTPTAYSWIYGSAPQVDDIPGTQRYTVSIELVTVPPEGVNVNGAELTITASILGGVVADNASAGFELTVTASLNAGAVSGDITLTASGAEITVNATLEAGSFTGVDASATGFDLTVTASIVGGAADSGASSLPVYVALQGPGAATAGATRSWPTHQINDIGILVVETSGDDSTITISTPSGWAHVTGSPVVDVADATGSKLQILWKRAASTSESNVSIPDTGDHQISCLFTFRGCASTGNPWDVIATGTKTTASTTATAPGVTTTVSNTLIAHVVGRPNDASTTTHFSSPTNANLSNITEIVEAGSSTAGNGGGFVLMTGEKASTGATGDTTITKSVSTTDTYVTIALKP